MLLNRREKRFYLGRCSSSRNWNCSDATATHASAGINPLPSTTVLVNNTTYYATQTVSCTSATSLAVTITVSLGNDTFNTISVKYYPNPVTDVLNISALTTITNVKVINLIGQQVYFKTINATDVKIKLLLLRVTSRSSG